MLRTDRDEEARLLAEAARQIERVGLGDAMPRSRPAACRWAGSAWSRSRGRWPPIRCCCCSTSRPPACATREKQALSELLRALRAEGLSILLVEHDMDFVMRLVDRLVVMDFGEKIAEGLPQRDPAATRR